MSDAILLWWGRDLYLYNAGNLTHHGMSERADAVNVIQSVLTAASPKPKGVRLVYQPSDLEMHAEQCPKGSRSMLRKTLGVDLPQLQNSAIAWAALEPKSTSEGGYSTLVFNEARPRLDRIDSVLASKGIRLVGAWPLARLVEARMSAAEANIALVSVGDHVMVFCCNPVGERDAYVHDGAEARDVAITDLRRAISQFESGTMSFVRVHHGEDWHVDENLGGASITQVELSDLLKGADSLKPDELACFTASEALISPSTLVKIASVACLLGACALGYFGFNARVVASREVGRLAKVRADLRAEVARLAVNKEKAVALNGFISETYPESLSRGLFLESVSRSCPPALTLTMIRVSEQGFVVSGNSTEGIGQKTGPFFTLLDALTNPHGKHWTVPVESRPETLQSPDFTVSGRFTRQAPILKSANN